MCPAYRDAVAETCQSASQWAYFPVAIYHQTPLSVPDITNYFVISRHLVVLTVQNH